MNSLFELMLARLVSRGWEVNGKDLHASFMDSLAGTPYRCLCTIRPNRRDVFVTIVFGIPVRGEDDIHFIDSLKKELSRRAYIFEWDGAMVFKVSRAYKYAELFTKRVTSEEFILRIEHYLREMRDLVVQCKLTLDPRSLPVKNGFRRKAPQPRLRVALCLMGWQEVPAHTRGYQ